MSLVLVEATPPDLDAYVSLLANNGTRILPGSSGTYWVGYESLALMRIPTFSLIEPNSKEVEHVLWKGRSAVVTYLTEPEEQRPANAWLYICDDPAYSLEKISPAMRRNVRRGLKDLTVRLLSPDEILAHGGPAFCDTRRRVGLSDGNLESFRRRFSPRVRCPGHAFIGAWKGDQLAAFLSIVQVDDWVEIEGCFSQDALLTSRPNDALMYATLSRYLVAERRRLVSYGLSSIQQAGNIQGLHAFKTKVGFQAVAVHRMFVLHPLLRPLANRVVLLGVDALRSVFPRNRIVAKTSGMLASLVRNGSISEKMKWSAADDDRSCA